MEWNSSSPPSSSSFGPDTLIVIAGLLREPAGTRPLVFAVVLLLYAVALFGNLLLCAAIYRDARLHRPMFILLATLALGDVVGCSATLPRILRDLAAPNLISVGECIAQTTAIHFYRALECFVLSAMALDRYAAICRPLRYHAAATKGRALAVTAAAVAAAATAVAPMLALALRLRLTDCPRPKLVPSAHCDNIALVNMACSDGSVNNAYGVALTTLTVGSSLAAVAFSYACIVRECLARRGRGDSSSRAAFGKSIATNGVVRSASTVGPNITTNKDTTSHRGNSTICPSSSTTTTRNTSTIGPSTSTDTTNTTARSTSAVGSSTSADTATTATMGGSSTVAPKTPIAVAIPNGTASAPVAGKGSSGQHSRAVSTCVTHLLVLAVFYAPLLFAVVYNRVDKLVPIPAPLRQALTCLFYTVPPALNPVIYGLRTGAIRRAVVAMVPRHRTVKGSQSSTLSLVPRSV